MATAPWDDSPPTVDERYEGSTSTSDLTVGGGMIPRDHKAGLGEVVAAAGLAAGRLKADGKGGYVLTPPHPASMGMALLRLHTEFKAAAKPRRVGPEVIAKLAEEIKRQDLRDRETAIRNDRPYDAPKPAYERAQDEGQRWYANELRLLAVRLKSRSEVMEHLTAWGSMKGIQAASVSAAILHWLDPSCDVCDGHGLRFLEHSAVRQCTKCHGGERKTDDEVQRVLRHIEYALGIARGRLRQRLRRGA